MIDSAGTRLFVISDLHLGGAPAKEGEPAFQMCTERGRNELRRFIDWAAAQHAAPRPVHLVIAGDIVDFLAEERAGGFQAFTANDEQARQKLAAIIEDSQGVWDALHALVARGAALTLLLGNHDLELSLPAPRKLLHDTVGPGRVEFIYDNQAFTLGKVLIEHGNRYDDWNAVPHDDLRQVRSKLSRGEPAQFDPLPGSHMVVELVNPTKKELAFIDLLKPEDAALLPFLALLSPDKFGHVSKSLQNRVRALRVRYRDDQQPKDRNYIAAAKQAAAGEVASGGTGDARDDQLLLLADVAAAGGDPDMATGDTGSFFTRWKAKLSDAYRDKQLDLLLRTLQAFRGTSQRAFDIAHEDEKYLRGAVTSATKFDVIVYGHTHLPKRIPLKGQQTEDGRPARDRAVYLNSGTWADLMAVPSEILTNDRSSDARARLKSFANDLASNKIERWRALLPTFVRVELDRNGEVEEAALELLGADDKPVTVTTELVRQRLSGAKP